MSIRCDSKVSSSTASNTSISCVFVWIYAFFTSLNVHCVQYFHCVFSDCNTFATQTDSSGTKVESVNIRIWANSARFYYRICFTGLLSDVLHCTCSAKIIFCPSHSQELFRFFLPVPTVLEVRTVAARCVSPHPPYFSIGTPISVLHSAHEPSYNRTLG